MMQGSVTQAVETGHYETAIEGFGKCVRKTKSLCLTQCHLRKDLSSPPPTSMLCFGRVLWCPRLPQLWPYRTVSSLRTELL